MEVDKKDKTSLSIDLHLPEGGFDDNEHTRIVYR